MEEELKLVNTPTIENLQEKIISFKRTGRLSILDIPGLKEEGFLLKQDVIDRANKCLEEDRKKLEDDY